MLNFRSDWELEPRNHPLPAGLTFIESAAAALRAYLIEQGLETYTIYVSELLAYQASEILAKHLPEAKWEPLPALTGGETASQFNLEKDNVTPAPSGVCPINRFHVVIGRWAWMDGKGTIQNFSLIASRSPADVQRLRAFVYECQHSGEQPVWQIVSDAYTEDPVPREPVNPPPVLDPAIAKRIETEVFGFFTEAAANLYRSLGLAYRRGVLLHGPPGNGKTSLIRYIGGRLPKVAASLLRPNATFNEDDLRTIISTTLERAPAILVIEDLDWMFKQVNVSTFLNLIDGVDTVSKQALLLIASTNHPDQLDPAITNRPGRFDVVMELPLPTEPLRTEFLSRHLAGVKAEVLETIVRGSDGLSFSHLLEIVRLAGLIALREDRSVRSDDDLLQALRIVTGANAAAIRGFPHDPEVKMGLQYLRR